MPTRAINPLRAARRPAARRARPLPPAETGKLNLGRPHTHGQHSRQPPRHRSTPAGSRISDRWQVDANRRERSNWRGRQQERRARRKARTARPPGSRPRAPPPHGRHGCGLSPRTRQLPRRAKHGRASGDQTQACRGCWHGEACWSRPGRRGPDFSSAPAPVHRARYASDLPEGDHTGMVCVASEALTLAEHPAASRQDHHPRGGTSRGGPDRHRDLGSRGGPDTRPATPQCQRAARARG